MAKRLLLLASILAALLALSMTTAAQGITYYVKVQTANVRSCAQTSCSVLTTLKNGSKITALETVQGASVSGSSRWYRISVNGEDGFIHSSLVTTKKPNAVVGATRTPRPSGGSAPPVSTSVPNTSSSGGGVSCPNMSATCSELTCDQAYACLNAGKSSLDRDHDGVPCESVCSGG